MMRVSMSYDNLSVVMSNSAYTHSCLRVLRVRVDGLSACVFRWLERIPVKLGLHIPTFACDAFLL